MLSPLPFPSIITCCSTAVQILVQVSFFFQVSHITQTTLVVFDWTLKYRLPYYSLQANKMIVRWTVSYYIDSALLSLFQIHLLALSVVGKWRIKRENFFGPFSAIFIPGLLFSTWPPFFYLAAYFYLASFFYLVTSSTMAHKARKIFLDLFLPMW